MTPDKQFYDNLMEIFHVLHDNLISTFEDIQNADVQVLKRRKIEPNQDIPDLITLFHRHLHSKYKLEGSIHDYPEITTSEFKFTKDGDGNFDLKVTKRKARVLFSLCVIGETIPDNEYKLLQKRQQDGIICDKKLTLSVRNGTLHCAIKYSIGYICSMNFVAKQQISNQVMLILDKGSYRNDKITAEYFYKSIADNTESMPQSSIQEFDIPELQTELLRFQKKTVSWLLSKENVKFNSETNRADPIEFMTSANFTENEALHLINKLWYGWKIIHWDDGKYFLNEFTCTVVKLDQMRKYLLEYYHDKDKAHSPLYLNGGVLADEMGLGKTMEIISLILLNQRPYYEIDRPMDLVLNEFGEIKKIVMGRTTLIIAPESILQQWRTELEKFAPGLSVTIYRGLGNYQNMNNKPHLIAAFLRKFDVVLTTYTTIARELDYAKFSSSHKRTRASKKKKQSSYPRRENDKGSHDESADSGNGEEADDQLSEKYQALFQLGSMKPKIANEKTFPSQRETDFEKALEDEIKLAMKHNKTWSNNYTDDYECPLMLIQFWRVVLDEVQMVSLRVSRAFQSASLIPRFHSWGVSGTPIKKNMDDLLATLKFLRFFPFNSLVGEDCWRRLMQNKEEFSKLWNHLAIRHTKSMVHDEIQLPEQNRILLTMPFTAIEQDLYSRKLELCLDEIMLDEDGNPIVDDWDIADVLESMRSWLSQLRKLCGLPQIGTLPQNTRKYRNSHTGIKAHNVGFLRPLKTLESLLHDMLDKCYMDIISSEKRRMEDAISFIEFLEFIFYPEKALKCLQAIIIETEWALKRDEVMLAKKLEEGKQQGIDLENNGSKKHLHTDDAYEEELFDDSDAAIDENENEVGDELYETFDRFGVDEDDELKSALLRIRGRIRSSLIQLHKLYFLKASCYFQLYDPDYGQIIEKFKVDVDIPVYYEEKFQTLDKTREADLASIVSGIPREQFLFEVDEENIDANLEADRLESIYYEKAEAIRGRLLAGSKKNVNRSIKARITSRELYFDKAPVDDGVKLLPKMYKKLFNAIPTMDVSDWSFFVMNEQVSVLVNRILRFLNLLNDQAEVMNDSMSKLLDLLQTPLISQDKSPEGHEYEDTLSDQDRISAHMNILLRFIESRTRNVSGGKGGSSSHMMAKIMDLELEKEFNNLFEKFDIPHSMQFSEYMDDLNSLMIDLSATATHKTQVQELKKLRDIFLIYQENQKMSLILFSKELNTSCNTVFNARVEYYRQLQAISDTVERPEYDDLDRENLTTSSIVDQLSKRDYRSYYSETDVARFRYLVGLMQENEIENGGVQGDDESKKSNRKENGIQEEDDRGSMCTICRCNITLGALTQCGHKYCKPCLDQWLTNSQSCPLCKSYIKHGSVYCYTRYEPVLKAKQVHDNHDTSALHSIYKSLDEAVIEEIKSIRMKRSYSSKVDMIVKQVIYLKKKDPQVQIVVFSQWQDMLYILGNAFHDNGISYVGSNNMLSHNQGINKNGRSFNEVSAFKNNNKITCFMLDARAEASGLTLVNATHILICEPLTNVSTEIQAVSRIHRIGQKKKTTVWMFAIENTVEESIVITSTEKRLKYLKSNKTSDGNNISNGDDVTDPNEDDLSKAESLALISGGAQDNVIGKKTAQGELVTNHDLWSAFFSSKLGRVIPDPSEKDG